MVALCKNKGVHHTYGLILLTLNEEMCLFPPVLIYPIYLHGVFCVSTSVGITHYFFLLYTFLVVIYPCIRLIIISLKILVWLLRTRRILFSAVENFILHKLLCWYLVHHNKFHVWRRKHACPLLLLQVFFQT